MHSQNNGYSEVFKSSSIYRHAKDSISLRESCPLLLSSGQEICTLSSNRGRYLSCGRARICLIKVSLRSKLYLRAIRSNVQTHKRPQTAARITLGARENHYIIL